VGHLIGGSRLLFLSSEKSLGGERAQERLSILSFFAGRRLSILCKTRKRGEELCK